MAGIFSAAAVLGCGTWARAQEPAQESGAPAATAAPAVTDSKGKAHLVPDIAKPQTDDSAGGRQGPVQLGTRFVKDQKDIWTSPARLRFSDTEWLVPLGGFAAGLFATDRNFNRQISSNPTKLNHYNTLSNAGIAALAGASGGLWLASHITHNDHWRETGFLAGEAALNSMVVVEGLKYSLRRQRPFQGDGSGAFFQNGGTSFPSEHAAAAWSIAGVIAHEYPGPLTKLLAYGLASAVSFSRVRADKHFSSDVFIGGMIGDLIAQHVYSKHHDPNLGGAVWESISAKFREQDKERSAANFGSPYVPLDSWVYPALDRLIALGYIHSAILGMRPWTRLECARLLDEIDDHGSDTTAGSVESGSLYRDLTGEFKPELTTLLGGRNLNARIESVYTRTTEISGPPLTDGYHFGQTIINDYGRPYARGFSMVNGFSGWATAGPFVGYFRGEYQLAPGLLALPDSARQVIGQVDDLPVPPALQRGAVHQFEILDAYVAMNWENWQFSFGRQSSWWGPDSGGPMLFSKNAEPINMFRIDRVSPFKLPSIFGWLGPMRVQFFLGQLSGHHFVFGEKTGLLGGWDQTVNPQPFIEGGKISLKPTQNLEFGISVTTVFAGQGIPFTTHNFIKSLFSITNANPGSAADPGDRRSAVDFTYKIPGLRNWLTFYADGYTDDQFSPIAYADRSAWVGGLYMPQIPGIRKLDFRVEGIYTDNPLGGNLSRGFYYFNDRYRNGYTNGGNLIGSWIGREGQGAQVWSTYWLSPRNRIQLEFRHQKVSNQFISGGGTLTNGGLNTEYWIGPSLGVSASVQYEKWNFPVLAPKAQTDITSSIQLTFRPHGGSH